MSIFILVISTALFIIIASAVVMAIFRRKKLHEVLQEQADKRNGYIESNSFSLSSRLILSLGEQTLNVYYTSGNKRRSAKTVAILKGAPDPYPRISVNRNTLFPKAMESFGKERFLTNNEEFDKLFVVSTNDESAARHILSMDIQENLLEMASKIPSLEIDTEFFRLMVMGILKDNESYDLFIDTALAILNKLGEKAFHA